MVTRDGLMSVPVAVDTQTRLGNAIYWYQSRRSGYDWDARRPIEIDDPFADTTEREVSVPNWVHEEDRDEYIASERQRDADDRADALFLATKMGRKNWASMCEQFDRKWDEAVAVKIGDGEWLFCGLASC